MVVEDEAEAEASSGDWKHVLLVCQTACGEVAWSGKRDLSRRMGQRCVSSQAEEFEKDLLAFFQMQAGATEEPNRVADGVFDPAHQLTELGKREAWGRDRERALVLCQREDRKSATQ